MKNCKKFYIFLEKRIFTNFQNSILKLYVTKKARHSDKSYRRTAQIKAYYKTEINLC